MAPPLLEQLFNHLVLPPKIPDEPDEDPSAVERILLKRSMYAAQNLQELTGKDQKGAWNAVQQAIKSMQNLNVANTDRDVLQDELKQFQPGSFLVIHIAQQNGALILRHDQADDPNNVIIEIFETAMSSEAVLQAKSALQVDFPGRAVCLPLHIFRSEAFQAPFIDFLQQVSHETVPQFAAKASKASKSVTEERDSVIPVVLTEGLMVLLESLGASVEVTQLRKRVRDDVNMGLNMPWRRLPLWLVLRVSLRRLLHFLCSPRDGQMYYKFLVAKILSDLLNDSTNILAPDLLKLLQRKLCRRLAKLQMDKDDKAASQRILFSSMTTFHTSIDKAQAKIVDEWHQFKRNTIRPVPVMRFHAAHTDLELSLRNSAGYLQQALVTAQLNAQMIANRNEMPLTGAIQQVTEFVERYFSIAVLELEAQTQLVPAIADQSITVQCTALSEMIVRLASAGNTAYQNHAGQMSQLVLVLFELWTALDTLACRACPLLKQYHPWFEPKILDVLQLSRRTEMERLSKVQLYLQARIENHIMKGSTCFDNPSYSDSFVNKYVQNSNSLQELHQEVLAASLRLNSTKQQELKKLCQEYQDHYDKCDRGTCVCTFNTDGERDVRGCERCWHLRQYMKMKISVHEDFLPAGTAKAYAMVFELGIPRIFNAYRKATWTVLKTFCYPIGPVKAKQHMILHEEPHLRQFAKTTDRLVSLASSSKAFLQTHYKELRMVAQENQVIVPTGLIFAYFDQQSEVWIKDFVKPLTLVNACGMSVPRNIQESITSPNTHPVKLQYEPSSYDIVANENKCPTDMSIHEFAALQRLLSGSSRRWLQIIVELESANINFSTESACQLINQLASEAGPRSNSDDVLRKNHWIFGDRAFCYRLAEQIRKRLTLIESTWRETSCLNMLIILSLKLFEFAPDPYVQIALDLILSARRTALGWVSRLQTEMNEADELQVAERAARYGFMAAILCRKTFTIYVTGPLALVMNASDLTAYVRASIALQQTLVVDLDKLGRSTLNLLISDVKLAFEIKDIVKSCIQHHSDCLNSAIADVMHAADGPVSIHFTQWEILQPQDRWACTSMTTSSGKFDFTQTIHFNFVEGHLLSNYKPLGKLPREIRESADVARLFTQQHLRTWDSALPGMQFRLQNFVEGCQVHFGTRNGQIVIQAVNDQGHYEFIPQSVFGNDGQLDLPKSLVEGCFHWLNLKTGKLEIRKDVSKWQTKPSDWIVDLATRSAQRRNSQLVDRHTQLFSKIASIFQHFEDSSSITVYQPQRGKLRVDLTNLALSFFVNEKGLLQSLELRAEIDPDQDAGTWYGFQSKLVLRSVVDPNRRSIITALGPLAWIKHGCHILVRAKSVDDYGMYPIDPVLCRLTCAPEPRLLYFKALIHAFTSFAEPDSLTQRTGAEEATEILLSGYCQPWTPLGVFPLQILGQLQSLVPMRSFYPPHKTSLQRVTWEQNLTATIQRDHYDAIIQDIVQKSEKLRQFELTSEVDVSSLESKTCPALRDRAICRRQLYERQSDQESQPQDDILYIARDRHALSEAASMIFKMSQLLLMKNFKVSLRKTVAMILTRWPLIGGFGSDSTQATSMGVRISNDISGQWGSLVQMSRQSGSKSPYGLMFKIMPVCFNRYATFDIIQILLAYARIEELIISSPPTYSAFVGFKMHELPSRESLFKLVASTNSIIELRPTRRYRQRDPASQELSAECERECRKLAEFFFEQWPSETLSWSGFKAVHIDVEKAFDVVQLEWRRLIQNKDLSDHVVILQNVLDRQSTAVQYTAPHLWNKVQTVIEPVHRRRVVPSLAKELICKEVAQDSALSLKLQIQAITLSKVDEASAPTWDEVTRELADILSRFTSRSTGLRRTYGEDLQSSLEALVLHNSRSASLQQPSPQIDDICAALVHAEDLLQHCTEMLQKQLSASDDRFQWLEVAGLWPCVSPISLLGTLASKQENKFGRMMKASIITYGMAITAYQRLRRVHLLHMKGDHRPAHQEWLNIGHTNWTPHEFPDWLLMEIDSDVLLRPEQIDVAHAIISPSSASNSVLQMNMGQGKTSCIMPICAATLANGSRLLRLLVPKSLLPSTAQVMQLKLGGLVGRSLCHIPYSRRTPVTNAMLSTYRSLQQDLMENCGILVTAPEHVLSFRLSGLQHLADTKYVDAKDMIAIQDWLDQHCRDILDESDFTLAVKTQLIYPSGSLAVVDAAPDRWVVAEELLLRILDHLPGLQKMHRGSIEIIHRQGAYPLLHILKSNVEKILQDRLLQDVCQGLLPSLRFRGFVSLEDRARLRAQLESQIMDMKELRKASQFFINKSTAYEKLLLVRGLLINNILIICLKKRWNVQYGLHPQRDPIAVPFEAKGVPSEQAEYGHPDVSIVSTILAFYYRGLTLEQFRDALKHVLSSADPSAEYYRWISTCKQLPEPLKYWNFINIEDHAQVQELWKHLKLNSSVLQHFLNNFVFNLHAKQFSVKLQLSGWDVPIVGSTATAGVKTTGFSGTNDNKLMLPLTIQQDDLPSLRQTNAEVMTYLLKKCNRKYVPVWRDGKRFSEVDLLTRFKTDNIRVFIDAGAYILEMDNQTLVKEWLRIDATAKAAVYFDAKHKAWVQYRGKNKTAPLLATSFADNLEECVVYLDEAHTRGVDLKLPTHARGALTLAPGQTKDSIAQAAMRLRLLATTQSVTFFAPPEVHQSIIDTCGLPQKHWVDSSHVIMWLMEQTCRANEQLQSLWLAQGKDYIRRAEAFFSNPKFLSDDRQKAALLKVLRQPERRSLEQIYGQTKKSILPAKKLKSIALQKLAIDLQSSTFASDHLADIQASAMEEVEQEREVEFQVEEEREIEKAREFHGLSFRGLHIALSRFAETGQLCQLERESVGYENAFGSLAETEIGRKYGIKAADTKLLISSEYHRTIMTTRPGPRDDHLRPVEWLLCRSTKGKELAVVVIPEEAEALIPILNGQENIGVHLIPYAAPVVKSMVQFNRFTFYALPQLPTGYVVPPWLLVELQIFSGSLFFDFKHHDKLFTHLSTAVGAENIPQYDGTSDDNHPFGTNPAGFVMEWLSLRRKGQDCSHSPMGYLCHGRSLDTDHHFFAQVPTDKVRPAALSSSGSSPATPAGNHGSDDDFDEHEDYLDEVNMGDLSIEDEDKGQTAD